MTHLYLTGIELTEFRTFEKLDIDLAPEPGVLIVHGSNGLGKSSLFDALEWTLTGDIDHFTSADGYEKFGNYLCRWGEGLGGTSSTLTFSDGNRIERQLPGPKAKLSTVSGVSDITEYLRLPDWQQPISALNRYLLLTHFLGQSSLSRLTHRKPGDRFQILKEVSQSDALQKFGLALHGPGQTVRAKAFTKRISQLQRDVEELADVLAQEAQLWSGAQAAGALDDGEAAAISAQIATALNAAWMRLLGKRAPFVWASLPGSGDLQSAIDEGAEQARYREHAISEARRLLALRDRHRKTLTEASGALEEAERELAATAVAVEAAKQEAERRQAVLSGALGMLTAAQETHAATVAMSEADAARDKVSEDLKKAEIDLAAVRSVLDESEQLVQRTGRRAQIETRLRDELDAAVQALNLTRASIDRGHRWLECADLIAKTGVELRDLEDRSSDIEEKLAIASSNLATARSAEDEAREVLSVVERSVSALSAAVSTVATHLPSGAHDCPICTTYFESPEDLSARAQDAADRLAPLVLVQQRALSAAEALVVIATNDFAQAQDVAMSMDSLREKQNSEREANDRLLVELGLPPASARSSVERWWHDRRDQAARLENKVRVKVRWLERLGNGGQAATLTAEATRRRDDARISEATAIRRVEDCTVDVRVAEERFAALSARFFAAAVPTKALIKAAMGVAASTLDTAQQNHYDAANLVYLQGLRLAPLQESEAHLRARAAQWAIDQSNARTVLAELPAQWRAAGWAEEGEEEGGIEKAASDLNQARQYLAEAEALLNRLRFGREAWNRQRLHRETFDRLRDMVDLAPNSMRDQIRDAAKRKLALAERDIAATASSKDIASKASNMIAEAVTAFNSDYIEPLEKLTKRINQAILCDPRIGIDLTVYKQTIMQSASVAGEMPNYLDKLDPMLVHSEGQMAALTVSLLCAASLTYPWSRWRALILDDPLQHNDAIHAAAFADLMGNLVKMKEYQILITTHDLGQSEFLRRKFDARGVPCAVLNLLGRGKSGVHWTFQRSPGGSARVVASS